MKSVTRPESLILTRLPDLLHFNMFILVTQEFFQRKEDDLTRVYIVYYTGSLTSRNLTKDSIFKEITIYGSAGKVPNGRLLQRKEKGIRTSVRRITLSGKGIISHVNPFWDRKHLVHLRSVKYLETTSMDILLYFTPVRYTPSGTEQTRGIRWLSEGKRYRPGTISKTWIDLLMSDTYCTSLWSLIPE